MTELTKEKKIESLEKENAILRSKLDRLHSENEFAEDRHRELIEEMHQGREKMTDLKREAVLWERSTRRLVFISIILVTINIVLRNITKQ